MCVNDSDIICVSREKLTRRQKNLCNDLLTINRDIVCSVLNACLTSLKKPVKCLEGIGVCGINGMLWEKHFGDDVDVTINGFYEEDFNIISQNVISNKMRAKVVKEDPCVLLRKNSYDFIYLNCKTNTSWYLDSVFSNIKENTFLIVTTAEDPSLYWQTSEIALRNYGGIIAKTSYNREVSVRLVMAEMARASARYHKGLRILCTAVYKPEQSFTIVAKIKKGTTEANECMKNIKKLAHCSLCENRKFISNNNFLDKLNNDLDCNCSKESEGKVVAGIGPLWAGEIFDADFIELMTKQSKAFPWMDKVHGLLKVILEEARCCEMVEGDSPPSKKMKPKEEQGACFYVNTHRLSSKEVNLQKLSKIIKLLQQHGYSASRTHFDSESVRTNASVNECIRILKQSSGS